MTVYRNGSAQQATALYHVPRFGGEIRYVDAGLGNDSFDGRMPDNAFATIGAAIAASAAGDAINIKAGTYDENGLDMNKAGLEMWAEIGVLINNTNPGTCLTISANSCLVRGVKVSQAGQIGFNITGAGCFLDHCISEGNSVAFDINGDETILQFCQDDDATTTGFDISSEENVLYLCKSLAAGGASRGFYLSHTDAHENMLYQCVSIGNGTAGYETVAGADLNVFAFCTSSSTDGVKMDAGTDNTWPSYLFQDKLFHTTDWSVVGGGAGSDNLFQVTRSVNILFIYGDVETQMHADVDNIKLELDDGTVQPDITNNVDTASAVVGSLFIKTETAANAMTLIAADQVRIDETAGGKKGGISFIVNQKNGVNSFIRCTWTGTGNTGKIHWQIQYEPLDEDGYIVSV